MSNFETLYSTLQSEFNSNSAKTEKTLEQLKIELAKLFFLSEKPALDTNQLIAARDALEMGALWNIRTKNINSFERYVVQLQTYYIDYKTKLPVSPRENIMTGLQLMNLIAQNRIADFHLALESLDPSLFESDPHIRHPVDLEKALMEGSYNKVLNNRNQVPAPEFSYFMDILVTTIQNEIASCCEKAYRSLPLHEISTMLFFGKGDDILAFASQRGWTVNTGNVVHFRAGAEGSTEEQQPQLPVHKILSQTMEYAKELERIV